MDAILLDVHSEWSFPELVTEAKGLHTYRATADVRQQVVNAGFDFNVGKFRKYRRSQTSKFSRQFETLSKKLTRQLIETTHWYLSREITYTKWVESVKGHMRLSYINAYEMGLQSAGVSFAARRTVNDKDLSYIESALRHEMRFFNRLLSQIREAKFSGSLPRRLSAYAEALKHMYYAGRIVGSPSTMIIDWVSPLDRATCRGCHFISENSPYHKERLPTTPRAGDTPCLNNCRCRLVMRTVDHVKLADVLKENKSKDFYRRRLSAIKSGKTLS